MRAFQQHYWLNSHTPNMALPRYAQRCKNSCEQLIRINAIGDIWFSFHFSVLLVLIGTRLRNAANPFEVECIVRLEALWALLMTLCVTFHLNIRNARNEKGLLKREDWYTWNLVADILVFILDFIISKKITNSLIFQDPLIFKKSFTLVM